jgi:prepilin-type N-terminal cleavage/methylation domain-containing protein
MKLREQAKKKLKKQGGFTLIEMLIVVAIIAILVAVAIPIVSSALSKTKNATDAANERSAKSVATIAYLSNEFPDNKTFDKTNTSLTYYFDATAGKLVASAPAGYGQCSAHSGNYLKVTIANDGTVTLEWSGGSDLHNTDTESEITAKA